MRTLNLDFEARGLDSKLAADRIEWHLTRPVGATDVGYRRRMRHSAHVRVSEGALDRYFSDQGSLTTDQIRAAGRWLDVPRLRGRLVSVAIVGDSLIARTASHRAIRDMLFDGRVEQHDRRNPVSAGILLVGIRSSGPNGSRFEPLTRSCSPPYRRARQWTRDRDAV